MKTFLKFFLIIFIPLLILFTFIFAHIDKIIEKTFIDETLNDLKSKWILLKNYKIPNKFDLNTYKILKKVSNETNLRITVIKKNGVVIFDSFLLPENIKKMENHKNRPEIKLALFSKNHEGYSIRFSHTLKIYMFYYAKILNKNLILRIAYPLNYVKKFKEDFMNGIGISFTYLIGICLCISLIIALIFSMPIKKLEELAKKIENDEKDITFPSFKDETFQRIGNVIYKIYTSMLQKQRNLIIEKNKSEFIFSILEEGIILLNLDNKIIYFNKKAEDYLNAKLEKGRNIFKLNGLNYNITNFLNVINNENGSFIRKLNGKTFEIYIKKIQNEKLFVFTDITQKLEYSEFKHQLIGNISHELKTPVATIMNAAETIINFENLTQEELKEFIEIIYRNSIKMDELIHDIIELHKLENLETLEIKEETVVDEILAEILTIYRDKDKNIVVEANVKKLKILPQHFQSLLQNLIDNAVKYSKGKNVYVSIKRKDDKIEIKVEDEGPLIPINERERIFERFYTLSKSRNKSKSGSGLGLSIVKHIAKLYNGSVKLEENQFGGNSFVVELMN